MKPKSLALALTVCLALFSCSKTRPHDKKADSPNTLSIALFEEPETLDPRLSRDLASSTLELALFEGLYVTTQQGTIPGMAKNYEVNDDGTIYTFKLRKAEWSDGSPVTAHDFEYTWKKTLSPDFPAPQADLLFALNNGREAKVGNARLEDVGVKALDDHTLQVQLVQPNPRFLQLVTTRTYLPICKKVDESQPKWADRGPQHFISNGPFRLERWKFNNQIYLVKNPRYWKAEQIQVPGLKFIVGKDSTALDLFIQGRLDWTGSPLGALPLDALTSLEGQARLHQAPAAAVHWLRLNTTRPPLSSGKVRRALAYALNRRELTEHLLKAGQLPAHSLVPPMPDSTPMTLFPDNTPHRARELLEEGLTELSLTKDTIPSLTISYADDEARHRTAQMLQQQWQEVLGIPVKLQRTEAKVVVSSLRELDYDMAIGSWFADVEDPLNFLDVFRNKDNGVNNTGWENALYASLLGRAEREKDVAKRDVLQTQAERLLMREMPCIPLYFATMSYAKSDRVKGVYVSPLGVMDFREASVEEALR